MDLNNKNRSKKVQNYIKQVKQNVYNRSERKEEEKKFNAKKEKKKKAEEAALLGFLQKSMAKQKKDAKKKKEAENDEEEEKIDNTGSINIYIDPREPDPKRSPKM